MNSINAITVHFEHPYLLFVLIPAIILAFLPYFLTKKKRRRNRNKITSLVLHVIIILLCTVVLTGMTFVEPDVEKDYETIILVDVSPSTNNNEENIETRLSEILDQIEPNTKVGIVTFSGGANDFSGFTTDKDKLMKEYKRERDADSGNATDIAAALDRAGKLFTDPENAKVILITDGIETENNLVIHVRQDGTTTETDRSAVRTAAHKLSSRGITVDTLYVEPEQYAQDMQINAVEFNRGVTVDQEFDVTVTVASHRSGIIKLDLYDRLGDGSFEYKTSVESTVSATDKNSVVIPSYKFDKAGLHTLRVNIASEDEVAGNNYYYAYSFIKSGNDVKILLVDGNNQSAKMKELLVSEGYSEENVVVTTPQNVSSAGSLNQYGEVILMNVNAASFPGGFADRLNAYAKAGGGVLTTGGENSYAKGNYVGSKIAEMLPVNVDNDEPESTAIMIVLDASGSMYYDIDRGGSSDSDCYYNEDSAGYQNTRMKYVKDALKQAAMTVFHEYDYIGLIHFGKTKSHYPITDLPLTQNARLQLVNAINNVKTIKGTSWKEPLEEAGNQLKAFSSAKNKHIIFITDGDPQDEKNVGYTDIAQGLYSYYGITLSTIAVSGDISSVYRNNLQSLTATGHGRYYECRTSAEVLKSINDECKASTIEEINKEGPYKIIIPSASYVTSGVSSLPDVGGFNGVTAKDGVATTLQVEYEYNLSKERACMYAFWDYGQGKVASFASDLGGWASEFYDTADGRKFLMNVVGSLMRESDEGASDLFHVDYDKKNSETTFKVVLDTEEIGKSATDVAVFYKYIAPNSNEVVEVKNALAVVGEDTLSGTLKTNEQGLYTLIINVYDMETKQLLTAGVDATRSYFTVSYSQEYDTFYGDNEELIEFLQEIAIQGRGAFRNDTKNILSIGEEIAPKVYDPSMWALIAAIVLFLLDIFVRKFNFLWPHEWFTGRKKTENLV